MKIFVDADACPVVGIVEELAKKYTIPVTLLCDTNHVISSDYSEVIVVGAGADAVDYKLISMCHKGDMVVSQDYGVAAMALGKGAYAIHQSGKWYTNENIDQMLMERHLNKKTRRASQKNHLKGPKTVSYTHLDVYKRQVQGRVKHFFSIYKKMVNQDKTLDQIYDLFAVRILVESVKDCYAALGAVSYTHLDVYKRQVLTQSRCSARWSRSRIQGSGSCYRWN